MLTMSRNEGGSPGVDAGRDCPGTGRPTPEFLDSLDRTPKGVNILSYMPLNPLMMYVMGLERSAKGRPANDEEMAEMRPPHDRGARGGRLRLVRPVRRQRRASATTTARS